MQLIDTHSHLYAPEFEVDRLEVVRLSKEDGIQSVLLPNEDAGSIDAINRLCELEPEFAYPMMGLHPTSVDEDYINELKRIENALSQRQYYGIGEIGIDLYWDKRFLKEQKTVFEEQLRWSIDLQLPVSIHSRDSFHEILDSIYNVGANQLKGVFHCFGGTTAQWDEISKLSTFFVGIGGVITYKNNLLIDALRHIPLERVVIETDAPYLAPVPYRGKRNQPSYLPETVIKMAECYQFTPEKIAKQTGYNASFLFGIPYSPSPTFQAFKT